MTEKSDLERLGRLCSEDEADGAPIAGPPPPGWIHERDKRIAELEAQVAYAQLAIWRTANQRDWPDDFDDGVCDELSHFWDAMENAGALEDWKKGWDAVITKYPWDAGKEKVSDV